MQKIEIEMNSEVFAQRILEFKFNCKICDSFGGCKTNDYYAFYLRIFSRSLVLLENSLNPVAFVQTQAV